MPFDPPRQRPLLLLGLGLVIAIGIFLRLPPAVFESPGAPLHALAWLHPSSGFNGIGFDESLYRKYVNSVAHTGLGDYPAIVDHYIEVQKTMAGSILPPVRFLYIFSAYLWHQIFGTEALAALRDVASFFSILTLVLSTIFAWRLKGPTFALGVAALMSVAPTQVHMSQHALVDGFFTFWALLSLWLLWENLRSPRRWQWLVPYVVALALLVTTKENSAFVWIALVGLMIGNRWLQFGTVSRELVLATILGPLLGVVILIFMAGGISTLIETYRLSVSKNYQLTYAILTGDGPWHRYLVDLLLVSPVVLLLAIGAAFRLDRTQKPELFLCVFIGASYLIMCNLKYGMNLRYANMWDLPLRVLALSQIVHWFGSLGRFRSLLITLSVLALCAYELRQYYILCVQYPLYELVTEGLLRALHILKSP
ncbi:MAG: phospholipid carrier-dependent glycosyltransferase [Spartobacteria bacterium]